MSAACLGPSEKLMVTPTDLPILPKVFFGEAYAEGGVKAVVKFIGKSLGRSVAPSSRSLSTMQSLRAERWFLRPRRQKWTGLAIHFGIC